MSGVVHCKNCRHWGVGAWKGESMLVDGWHECAMAEANSHNFKLKRHPETLAAAHGGDLGSYLFTAPDFGCVQGERK